MWKNIVELGRPQMTVWRMRSVCWMSKTTSTHSEYVTLIAFLLQQLLHERASVLRYMYTACHVFSVSVCTHLAYSVCLLHLSFYVAFKCFQLAYSPAPTPTLPPISCSPPFRVILIMCKPCAMCSSVNRWLLRLAVTDCTSRVHVSGYHLYLCRFNNMSIRVQITCVFFKLITVNVREICHRWSLWFQKRIVTYKLRVCDKYCSVQVYRWAVQREKEGPSVVLGRQLVFFTRCLVVASNRLTKLILCVYVLLHCSLSPGGQALSDNSWV